MLLQGGIQPTTWCYKLWNSSKQSVQCWQEIDRIDIECMPSENESSTMESLLEVIKPIRFLLMLSLEKIMLQYQPFDHSSII